MDKKFFEAKYYMTYYFANTIQNILSDPYPYLRKLDEFYGDDKFTNFITPFQKHSAFHQFIEFVINGILYEDMESINISELQKEEIRFSAIPSGMRPNPRELPINRALNSYGIAHESFDAWLKEQGKPFSTASEDDVSEYFQDLKLSEPFDDLINHMVEETFFIMFLNRGVLLRFNDMMAGVISQVDPEEVPIEDRDYFERDGVLKRAPIPPWAKEAVLKRDYGLCNRCHQYIDDLCDLSTEKDLDFMVPIEEGGLNDVTNIHLLCDKCRKREGGGDTSISELYQTWY